MVVYKCKKCGDEFPSRQRYDAHMNRKTDCTLNIEHRKPIVVEKFECPHCQDILQRKDSLKNHIEEVCPKNPIRLNKFIKENNKIITPLNNNNISGQVNINNKNIDNSIAAQTVIIHKNTINMIPFDESISMFHMTGNEIDKIFNSKFNPYLIFFELIYLNLDKPEYQTVRYVDDDTVLVFTQNDWYRANADKVMLNIIINERDSMSRYLSKMCFVLEKVTANKIYKTIMSTSTEYSEPYSEKKSMDAINELKNIRTLMKNSLRKYKPGTDIMYNDDTCSVARRANNTYQKTIMEDINHTRKNMQLDPFKLFIDSSDSSSETNKVNYNPIIIQKNNKKKSVIDKSDCRFVPQDEIEININSTESSENDIKLIINKKNTKKINESGSCNSDEKNKKNKKKSSIKNKKSIKKNIEESSSEKSDTCGSINSNDSSSSHENYKNKKKFKKSNLKNIKKK
jgi:hypothetical protein